MKTLDTKTLKTVSGGALIKIGNPTISIAAPVSLAPTSPLLASTAKIS